MHGQQNIKKPTRMSYCKSMFPKSLLVAGPFWLRKKTALDPHIFAQLNIVPERNVCKIRYLYL